MNKKNLTLGQMVQLIRVFGWEDFTMKYRGSVLGYFWSFMAPLVKFLVILFVFGPFVRSGIPHYPLYLFLGVIVWEHFSLLSSACLSIPFEKAMIIKNVRFSRWLLLPVSAWTHAVIFLTYFLVFLVCAVWLGVYPGIGVLYMILILFQMSLFAVGVGGFLGAFVLKYRDIRHLWDVMLTILFWLTPIMYPYRIEAPLWQEFMHSLVSRAWLSPDGFLLAFIRFQPLSVILFDVRRVLLYGHTEGVPSLVHAVGFTLLCFVIGLAGLAIFRYRSRFFLEEY